MENNSTKLRFNKNEANRHQRIYALHRLSIRQKNLIKNRFLFNTITCKFIRKGVRIYDIFICIVKCNTMSRK